MISCDNQLVILDTPSFDVKTNAVTYKAGDLVTFNITGNAHAISFYSGQTLYDYDFRAGRVVDVTGAGDSLSFSSSVQLGTQANQLSILASTDFNGDYTSLATVKAATWTDITSRFALGTNATFKASGTQAITDLTVAGKPIYIAFKYVTLPQGVNGLARQWFIQTFAIKSTATLPSTASVSPITLTLTDQLNAGFRIIGNSPVNNSAISSVTATRVTLWGNEYRTAALLAKYDSTLAKWDKTNPMYDPNSPLYVATAVWAPYVPFDPNDLTNDPSTETWAVSAPVNLTSVNLGPDWSTAIKAGIASAVLTSYTYTYDVPGTFKAVFVGENNSINETKEVIKEITVTITP